MSWHDAFGLSLTSRVCLEADRMLHSAHCAWRTAPSAPHAVTQDLTVTFLGGLQERRSNLHSVSVSQLSGGLSHW